jgi:hypothetical protein
MADLKRYWQEIRAIERSLPQFAWLVSIEDEERDQPGGRIAEMPAARAALLLHQKSHRIATSEEISAHHAQQEQAEREQLDEQRRHEGIAIIVAK